MLSSVGIDPVDPAFDIVPTHAGVVMIAQQGAFAGFDHKIAPFVELRRLARVREPPPAERTWCADQTAPEFPFRESDLGDEIINARKVVVLAEDLHSRPLLRLRPPRLREARSDELTVIPLLRALPVGDLPARALSLKDTTKDTTGWLPGTGAAPRETSHLLTASSSAAG